MKYDKSKAIEAGRLADLAHRQLGTILLKFNRAEFNKYGADMNRALNLLDKVESLLPPPDIEGRQ